MGIIIPMERIVKKLWSSEFVSREAVYQTLTEYYHHTTEWMHSALREAISRVPAADVVSAGAYEQTAWERDTAIAQLAEIGKAFGETMDDAIEERKFYEFLWNTIQPNEMEQYISMYRAQGVPSDASREKS